MPPLRITVNGVEKLNMALEAITEEIIEALKDGIEYGSSLLAKAAAANHPRFGRQVQTSMYGGRVSGSKGSDEGRAKNPDGSYRYFDRTGNLTASIQPIDVKREGVGLHGGVLAGGTGVLYAEWVEFGTARNRAFPFMGSAVEAKGDEVIERIRQRIDKLLK